jgi:hypothetical protein
MAGQEADSCCFGSDTFPTILVRHFYETIRNRGQFSDTLNLVWSV